MKPRLHNLTERGDMIFTEPCQEISGGPLSRNTPTFSQTGRRGSKLIDFNLEGSKMQLIRPPHDNVRRVKTPTPYIKRLKVKERIPASPSSGAGTFSITEDIHTKLKSVLRHTYKIAEKAFTEFDFQGEGAIPIDRFITQHPLKKTGYTPNEIKEWLSFKLKLLDQKDEDKISWNAFKTLFFPVEVSLNGNSSAVSDHTSKKNDAESRIKRKIANKYSTVRKAFLSLDYNYDGFIVAQDIIRLFINDNEHISYEEVSNLLRRKQPQKNGKLDFAKFCSWVGSLIEPNHGVFQPSLNTIEANNIPPPLPKKPFF